MSGQKARAYYDELYKAGGLSRLADQYVCFDEKPENENFFIFAKSDTLKKFLVENNGYATLPAASKAKLTKGFITVRQYSKGLPLGNGLDDYMKDGESWLGDPFQFDKVTKGRMRLQFSFETLRYKRSVEITKVHVTREAAAAYGKCEEISPEVRQKAD